MEKKKKRDCVIYFFLWKCRLSLSNLNLYEQNFIFSSDSFLRNENRFARYQSPYRVAAGK